MSRHDLSIAIQANADKVWDVLWNKDSYPVWTYVFYPGSHAEGEWIEGGNVHFLSPEKDGIVSRIVSCKPGIEMRFRHIGMVEKGKEILTGSMIDEWGEAIEEYYLEPTADGTLLKVVLAMETDMMDDMLKVWPAALDKIKELAEG